MSGLVQFRCHFLDGSTVEVSAPNAAIARAEARARHPGVAITKVKVVKGASV
ncbi:hypothetical protein [Mesorhizobium sp. Z1-4]|uniref:hypothetical protein n=1 Tax=Mesorhizobium sp. Z1-4 TaxID=2448478 RepID=UPI0013DEE20A|nr:hypothetical protein [Mesorhizobium sp. Z1-4]